MRLAIRSCELLPAFASARLNRHRAAKSASANAVSSQRRMISATPTLIVSITLITFSLIQADAVAGGKSTTKGKISGSESTETGFIPMAIQSESYDFRYSSRNCLGEDDVLTWQAAGELKPGESFSFTPQYPGCQYHPAAISAVLDWQGSELELTSTAPDNDMASQDPEQKYSEVVAPAVGSSAQLCLFPFYRQSGSYYTITVTNIGQETARNIRLDGQSSNDWPIYFYNRCMNADADLDGWNDSLEHSMSQLLYPVSNGESLSDTLWGSNYLKATAASSTVDDEVDSSPVDFNDDGIVDSLDVDEIVPHLGSGNGIPLERISPNPDEAEYIWANAQAWRRYDLDGDGQVTQADIDIVSTQVGRPLPMAEDNISPTARLLVPAGAIVARGSYFKIQGHVWDNATIARVEYLVDDRVICTATQAVPSTGKTSPFYFCWWQVPKRGGEYALSIRVSDTMGNITTSDTLIVNAQ